MQDHVNNHKSVKVDMQNILMEQTKKLNIIDVLMDHAESPKTIVLNLLLVEICQLFVAMETAEKCATQTQSILSTSIMLVFYKPYFLPKQHVKMDHLFVQVVNVCLIYSIVQQLKHVMVLTSDAQMDHVLKTLSTVKNKFVLQEKHYVKMDVVQQIKKNAHKELHVMQNIQLNVLTVLVLKISLNVVIMSHVLLIWLTDVPTVNVEEHKANAQ